MRFKRPKMNQRRTKKGFAFWPVTTKHQHYYKWLEFYKIRQFFDGHKWVNEFFVTNKGENYETESC